MIVPFNFHGQLIGQKGKEIRQIMDECGVTVAIPRPDECSDVIQIIGPPSKIDGARKMIEKKLQSLEEERKQRVNIVTAVIFVVLLLFDKTVSLAFIASFYHRHCQYTHLNSFCACILIEELWSSI